MRLWEPDNSECMNIPFGNLRYSIFFTFFHIMLIFSSKIVSILNKYSAYYLLIITLICRNI